MTTPRRTPGQYELAVESTEWLTPHLVRVVASGESLSGFADNGFTDLYVKLIFVDPELGLAPPYDVAELRATLPPDRQPVVRTYTVRWVDRVARRLAIDFVTHGDAGVAAPWAAAALPGDRLVMSGPGGAYVPDPATAWHVLVGDLSALPAIAASLEGMPGDACGVAYVEIGDTADILDLKCPEQVALHWLVNPDPDDVSFLARALDSGPWPADAEAAGVVQVFAHGERESVKAIRGVLRERKVPREAVSISGYWARGRTEDVFQSEKREPIGRID